MFSSIFLNVMQVSSTTNWGQETGKNQCYWEHPKVPRRPSAQRPRGIGLWIRLPWNPNLQGLACSFFLCFLRLASGSSSIRNLAGFSLELWMSESKALLRKTDWKLVFSGKERDPQVSPGPRLLARRSRCRGLISLAGGITQKRRWFWGTRSIDNDDDSARCRVATMRDKFDLLSSLFVEIGIRLGCNRGSESRDRADWEGGGSKKIYHSGKFGAKSRMKQTLF